MAKMMDDAVEDHAVSSAQLEREAAELASDILPYLTQMASVEAVWSPQKCSFISNRRKLIHGHRLFFDELLSFASVESSLYPPQSNEQLSSLLKAIFAAPSLDYLKQLSLVYYLFIDLDAYLEQDHEGSKGEGRLDQNSKADAFANSYVILPQFCEVMQGYWKLDNDQYEEAIPLLSVADFIPKIIRTIFLPSSSAHNRLDVARARLLLRFLQATTYPSSSAPGTEEHMQEVEYHIQALCFVSGPTRALNHIRALTSTVQDDEEQRVAVRARLIFKVLEHCFAPPKAAAIQNLLAASLDAEEEVALESFVLSPPAVMTATWSYVAADVLIIRYINQGRYMDAVGLDRRLGPDVSQGHATAKDAAERVRMTEQRKKMIAGAREILPEVQKELLRIEESAEISESSGKKDASGALDESVQTQIAASSSIPPLAPLSASPSVRHLAASQAPTTQAAILSAVVRASASPSPAATPTKSQSTSNTFAQDSSRFRSVGGTPRSASKEQAGAMIGFLAKNALDRRSPSLPRVGSDADGDDHMQDVDGSAVLVPTSSELAADAEAPANVGTSRLTPKVASSASSPAPVTAVSSPWRNKPTLTSTSPFSGLPKIPKPAFAGSATGDSISSPYRKSPGSFQPPNHSPFAASTTNRSLSGSPSMGSVRLPGAIGLVSQHTGRRSRFADGDSRYREVDKDEQEESINQDEEEERGDDTFVDTERRSLQPHSGDVNIGRLVPGRRGWKESNEDSENNEMSMTEQLFEEQPPTKRRSRSAKATATTPAKSKLTRSSTTANLSSSASSSMPKSRSEARGLNKRATRSTTAVNRKPLTLSNLEQHETESQSDLGKQNGSEALTAAPIARRTRAATAELESLNGDGGRGRGKKGEDEASTIYTISEVGDGHDGGVGTNISPAKRRSTKRATASKVAASTPNAVRRSSRLSSVEPESGLDATEPTAASPAKRRGGRKATATLGTSDSATRSRMPGGLD